MASHRPKGNWVGSPGTFAQLELEARVLDTRGLAWKMLRRKFQKRGSDLILFWPGEKDRGIFPFV